MDIRKLIECVRSFECIYDINLKEYRKKNVKVSAWEQISEQMNLPAFDCKKRWTELRNAYLHAVKRRRNVAKMFHRWPYESEMSFLLPFLVPKYPQTEPKTDFNAAHQNQPSITIRTDNTNTNDSTADESSSTNDFKEDNQFHLEVAMEMSDVDPVLIKEEYDDTEFNSEPTPEIENTESEKEEVAIAILNHLKKSDEKDDIDMFFASMAKTVKKLPESEQIRLKAKIFQIVNDAEIKFYTPINMEATVKVEDDVTKYD